MREKCYGPEIHLLTYKITKKKSSYFERQIALFILFQLGFFYCSFSTDGKDLYWERQNSFLGCPQADHAVNPNTCYHILGSKNKAHLQGLHISFFVPIKMSSCDEMTGQILQKCFLYSLFLFWGFKLLSASLLNESVALLCPTRCGHQKNCEFLCHKTSVS